MFNITQVSSATHSKCNSLIMFRYCLTEEILLLGQHDYMQTSMKLRPANAPNKDKRLDKILDGSCKSFECLWQRPVNLKEVTYRTRSDSREHRPVKWQITRIDEKCIQRQL